MQPTRTCSFDGCDRPYKAKGLCQGHYCQQLKGQALRHLHPSSKGLTLEQRFWMKVNKTAGCWEWTGLTAKNGYGRFSVEGRLKLAHRVSWSFVNGTVPGGMYLDHRCANRACVNPAHLRVVTQSQNMQHLTRRLKNNTSGVRGVFWEKRQGAWRVQVTLNGRKYWGGYHSTIESATEAAQVLRNQLFTHDDHDEWEKDLL